MKIVIQRELEIPMIPNFVRFGPKETDVLDVKDLSDKDLKRLAQEWTRALLRNAKERRATP